ncbi:MAG: hypothetical protein ACTSRP_04435 [Candidatus Helarchaeota archaeon]
MSHEQVWSIWDTGFFGYSELNILLQNYFLEVSEIKSSLLNYIDNFTNDDILFLNVAKFGRYSDEEINKIVDFVNRGGKLIVLGEHKGYNFSNFQNQILINFGMELTNTAIEDIENKTTDSKYWIIFDSFYFNLTNLNILSGAVINITGNNTFSIANTSDTANYPNAPVMAGYSNSNGGKVFCCSDSEWLSNFNATSGGIHYGNNSKLLLKVLDWFYQTNLSKYIKEGLKIKSDYNVFTAEENTKFILNLTLTKKLNVSTHIEGGTIFPHKGINLEGRTNWQVLIKNNGYIQFVFTHNKLKINISKLIFFFKNKNFNKKILFLQHNYSRIINPSPDGLLKFAINLYYQNFSIFSSSKSNINISDYNCIFILNPLRTINNDVINEIKFKKIRVSFFSVPYASLNMTDVMYSEVKKTFGYRPNFVPINICSKIFGFIFSRYIVVDPKENINNKIYYPILKGIKYRYEIACFFPLIINITGNLTEELKGKPTSWGEDHTTFGTVTGMIHDNGDIINTCVLAYNKTILANGILNFFINEFYTLDNNDFNECFFNWLKEGVWYRNDNSSQEIKKENENFFIYIYFIILFLSLMLCTFLIIIIFKINKIVII